MRRLWILFLVVMLLAACSTPATPTSAPAKVEPTKAPAKAEPTTAPAETKGDHITVAGSTTVQPLAEKLAEAFAAKSPGVEIDVQGGGSSVGVKSAGQGTTEIGMASRKVKQSELDEYKDLKVYAIAYDGIAIAVNPGVDVKGLTMDQVKGIFSGEIKSWKEVGGADKPIVVVAREEGSGTRAAFEEMAMGEDGPPIVDRAILQPSNGAVRTTVSSTPDAVGFLSFGYLDNTVKALEVDGAAPTPANAMNGSYPIVRPLNMMTKGDPSGAVAAWLDFIMSDAGQEIVAGEGYIAVTGGEEAAEEPAAGERITAAGSTTVQPLAEKLAEAFAAKSPGVEIDVQGGGSSVGVKSAGQGTTEIGMASRKVKQSELDEYKELKVYAIAYDGIAIAVNPGVDVKGLTKDQVKGIFAGEIKSWKEVGGADKPIVVVAREEGSGTRAAFEEMVMGEDAVILDRAILQPSNGAVRTTVSSTPDSVGFLSFGYLDSSVKALKVDDAAPTPANAMNGSYPVVRPLNMMTLGEPQGAVKGWLDFIMSDAGQAIVADEGYIAVTGGEEAAEEPAAGERITAAGSTTVQPLAEKLAEAFIAKNPGTEIDVQGGGSSVGVKSAGQGTTEIGMASRKVKQSELDEYKELKVYAIAYDGIAVVVNPGVTVDGLTKDQVKGIFAGEIKNWKEVGGPSKPIVVVAREEGSGTRAAFEEMVMGEDAVILDRAILQPSNGAVRTTVSSTPDSVGFLSFGYLDSSVKALKVDGAAPTPANAMNGSYPVVRPLNMMTLGEPQGAVKGWLDFIMSDAGQAIAEDEGYISVSGGAEATASVSGKLTAAGSTTVQPLAEKLAEAFIAKNPGVEIDVQGGGSSVGVKSAGQGTTEIGMASRKVKQSELDEYKELKVYAIAYDGIAVVVNPGVTVDGLTKDQVKGIFAGEIKNWNEVGGPSKPIVVVAREEGSGTRAAFEEMVMGEDAVILDRAILQPSNGAVRTTVSSTPDSVGFLSFGYLDSTVKALKVDGAVPTPANAMNGSYPVVRPLNMMTLGEPEGVVKGWLDFIMSDAGQAIAEDEGYIAVSGGSEAAAPVSGSVTIAGSTTVQPLAEKLAEAFIANNPGASIDVQGGGSSVGVKSAGQGTTEMGMASRKVKQSELDEYKDLKVYAIAYDGIAVAVNPGVTVDGLTLDQVKSIFAGEIKNWKDVGGADKPIVVVAREEGSGTRAAFEEMVMGEDAVILDRAILQPSNGAVRTTVSSTPDSVGFLSFGYLDSSVKALKVDGAVPTPANAMNGSYPVVRPLNMMTLGEPEGVVKGWLDFIMSDAGQAIVADEGYIAVK